MKTSINLSLGLSCKELAQEYNQPTWTYSGKYTYTYSRGMSKPIIIRYTPERNRNVIPAVLKFSRMCRSFSVLHVKVVEVSSRKALHYAQSVYNIIYIFYMHC